MKKITFLLVILMLGPVTYAQTNAVSQKKIISELQKLDSELTKIDQLVINKAIDLVCADDEEMSVEQKATVAKVNELKKQGQVIASKMQKLHNDYMATATTYPAMLLANDKLSPFGFGVDPDFVIQTRETDKISDEINSISADLAKVQPADLTKKVGLQDQIMRKQCEMNDIYTEYSRKIYEKSINPLSGVNNFVIQRKKFYESQDAKTWYCDLENLRSKAMSPYENPYKCYQDDLAKKIQEATNKMYPQKNKLDESDNKKVSKPSDKSKTEAGFQLPGFNSTDPNLGSGLNIYPQSVKPDELSKIFAPAGTTQPAQNGNSNSGSGQQQSGR